MELTPTVGLPARGRLFFWAAGILIVNGLLGHVLRYVADHGLAKAVLDVFGVSVIIWLAAAASLALLFEDDSVPATRQDVGATALSVVAALLPTGVASLGALTGLAIYIYLSSRPHRALRGAAAILLSITVATLWGRVVLALFSRTMLRIDSILVGFLGVSSNENELYFANDAGALGPTFVVAPGCSSLHSVSLAVVFCTLVHGWFGIRPSAKSLIVGGIAILAVIGINTLRIGAIAFFPEHFDEIHAGTISSLIAWATIIAIVVIVGLGMRREIFRQG